MNNNMYNARNIEQGDNIIRHDNTRSKRPRKPYAMRTRAKVESKRIAPKTSPMQGTSADDKEARRQEDNNIYERQEYKPNARDEYI